MMKAVAKTVEPADREVAVRAHPSALSRSLDARGAAASPAPRCHQGRVRSSQPRRHQFRAGAAAVQYRGEGADRRRAANPRLLPRLQRFLQSEEARRDGLPRSSALARRSPFGAHQAHREGRRGARHRRCALSEACAHGRAGRRHQLGRVRDPQQVAAPARAVLDRSEFSIVSERRASARERPAPDQLRGGRRPSARYPIPTNRAGSVSLEMDNAPEWMDTSPRHLPGRFALWDLD